jgi:hypothetical protein
MKLFALLYANIFCPVRTQYKLRPFSGLKPTTENIYFMVQLRILREL